MLTANQPNLLRHKILGDWHDGLQTLTGPPALQGLQGRLLYTTAYATTYHNTVSFELLGTLFPDRRNLFGQAATCQRARAR